MAGGACARRRWVAAGTEAFIAVVDCHPLSLLFSLFLFFRNALAGAVLEGRKKGRKERPRIAFDLLNVP